MAVSCLSTSLAAPLSASLSASLPASLSAPLAPPVSGLPVFPSAPSSSLRSAPLAAWTASRSSCRSAVRSRLAAPGAVRGRLAPERRRLGKAVVSGRHRAADRVAATRPLSVFRLWFAVGQRRWPAPALIVAMVLAPTLMLLAATAAPEQPQSQEAICQRHHGVEACAVW